MITRLYIDNYASLVNFELRLSELALLVGRNGSGKTSVLSVMRALGRLLAGGAKVTDADAFPFRTLTRWQARETQVVEVECQLGADVLVYRIEIIHEPRERRARIGHESLISGGRPLFDFAQGVATLHHDDHSTGPQFRADPSESALARVQPGEDNTRLTRFLDHMKKIIVCDLSRAGFSPDSSDEQPMLQRDGANFAAWCGHMLLERPDLVSDFTAAVMPIIDELLGIRMKKIGLDTRAMMVVFEHDQNKYELRFDEISDGQRALIALYALIKLTNGQGYTLFLDEPENYIDLAEIQPWLMELSDACGAGIAQAVICSHHPEIIDYLGPENGILLRRESTGVTTARPVAEIPLSGGFRLSEFFARGDDELRAATRTEETAPGRPA